MVSFQGVTVWLLCYMLSFPLPIVVNMRICQNYSISRSFGNILLLDREYLHYCEYCDYTLYITFRGIIYRRMNFLTVNM